MSTPTPIRPALGPRQLSNGRRASVEPRLGAIDEDGGMQPDVPARAHNRPFDRMFALGFPPRRSQEHAPPPYSQWDEITGPRGEKFSDVRNNRYLARRGGWKRCFLILVLVICIIVALVVGLVVGLKHGHHHKYATATCVSAPVLTCLSAALQTLHRRTIAFLLARIPSQPFWTMFRQTVLRTPLLGSVFRIRPTTSQPQAQ